MFLRSWKNSWAESWTRKRVSKSKRRRRTAHRPISQYAEVLEGRLLLAISAGSLDPTFGDAGQVSTTDFIGSRSDLPRDVIAGGDRSAIVGGVSASPGIFNSGDFALARYTPDGDLDPNFGDGGLVRSDFGFDEEISHLALDESGNIIAVGSTNEADFVLARYLADGSLDTTFGNGGLVRTVVTNRSASVIGVALIDGDIIVAGQAATGSLPLRDLVLARYESDGSLDTTFGDNGLIFENLNDFVTPHAMTIDSNGRIVTVGETARFDSDLLVVRHLADGSLDSTFGNGTGMVRMDLGGTFEQLLNVATTGIDDDYRIVAHGRSLFGEGVGGVLMQFTEEGSLDTSFGTGGKVVGIDSWSTDLAIDANGGILVADVDSLDRYLSNGQIDSGFGDAGRVVGNFHDLALDSFGHIVAAGFKTGFGDFVVTRLSSTGALDDTFGESGIVETDFIGPIGSVTSLGMELIPSNGKTLAVVAEDSLTATSFTMTRYDASGELDASFGEDGKIRVDAEVFARDFLLDDEERIVILGAGGIMRFLVDGSFDTTFGNEGIAESNPAPFDFALDSQGRLVVLGQSSGEVVLHRYLEDGSLDESFVNGPIPDLGLTGLFGGLVIDQGNRILVKASNGVARFLENGALDTGFGVNGLVAVPFADLSNQAVALDPQGRILVGGTTGIISFAVYRLNEDGTLDTTFGDGGLALKVVGSHPNSSSVRLRELIVDEKGRIVAAGTRFTRVFYTITEDVVATRWTADGAVDTDFGVASAIFNSPSVTGAAIDAQGHIVVAGRIGNAVTGRGIGLARFVGDVPKVESVDIGADLKSIFIQLNDDDLEASLAADRSNYSLRRANGDADGDGNFFNDGDESVAVPSNVIYDAATDRITLRFVDAVFADVYRFEIDGDDATTDGTPGLANENGFFLLGGDYRADFDLRALTFVEALLDKVESLGLINGAEQSLTSKLESVAKKLQKEVGSDNSLTSLLTAFRLKAEEWFEDGELTLEERDDLFADVDLILLGLDLTANEI